MSSLGPTQEEYDSLIYKLATLESELGQARKLLEAPKKAGWWRRLWAVAALVMLLLVPGISHARTLEEMRRAPLVGLKGMDVVVEDIGPAAERLGLTRDQIKTDVELRLRKAGIRVLTEKESFGKPGAPHLYVNVNIAIGSSFCAYSIVVELKEWGTFARGFGAFAAIWNTSAVAGGGIGMSTISQIRGSVGDQVDKFINDYLAANPKR